MTPSGNDRLPAVHGSPLTRQALRLLRCEAALSLMLLAGLPSPVAEAAEKASSPSTLVERLRTDVNALATEIGPRGVFKPGSMPRAADYIAKRFAEHGHTVRRLAYEVGKTNVENIEVELRGSSRPEEIVIIGAHYDTVVSTPGADDNASGVAVLLSLADALVTGRPHARTVRLVAFANEEPAYFQTELMGSRVYARACRGRGDNIVAMVSMDSVGYYSDKPGSQRYPQGLPDAKFPSHGNFLGLIGNPPSEPLLVRASKAFRAGSELPLLPITLPEHVEGAGWSDHWSFWREGYPAIMATDTAHLRNPNYHRPSDQADTLDYTRLASVASGVRRMLLELARAE
jgi:Zn-dependent M28 family amino/carboxypeptidase